MDEQREIFPDRKPAKYTMAGALRTYERWYDEALRLGLSSYEADRYASNKTWEQVEQGLEVPPPRKQDEPF